MTSALMAMSLLSACNQHTHDWGEVTYTWSSDNTTCTAERVCKSDESHKETETANSTYAVVTEAKCEEDGKGRYSVSFENEAFVAQSKDIVLNAIGHEWGAATYVWADDNSSCTATRVCAHDASHKETETKNSTLVPITPATCTEAGVGKYVVEFENSAFAKQEKDNIVIDALNHDYQFDSFVWSEKWDSAQAKYVCSHDESHIELHEAKVDITTIPAECETDGKMTFTATYDNHSDIKESIIPAKNHSWGEPTYVWSKDHKTCTAKRVCANDSAHIQEETVNSSVSVQEAATCEQDGYGKFTVEFVNTAFAKQEEYGTIAKLGHDYQFDSFVWDEDFEAEAKYICSRNENHIEYHKAEVTNEVTTEPGCETEGVKTYTATYDGHTGTATESVDAIGHKWGEPIYELNEDKTQMIAKIVCKNDTSHIKESETVDIAEREVTEPTDRSFGHEVYTAHFTNPAFSATKVIDIPLQRLHSAETTDKYKLFVNDDGETMYATKKDINLTGDFVMPKTFYSSKTGQTYSLVELRDFGYSAFTSILFNPDFDNPLTIADNTFQYCYENFNCICLPASLISIGENAFKYCRALENFVFDGTMEQWNAVQKGNDWNSGCSKLNTIHCFDGDVTL